MGKTQTFKQAKLQRKAAFDRVQAPAPTPPLAAVQQVEYMDIDPPPFSTPPQFMRTLRSSPSQPAYTSFSELYYNDVSSLASSSTETLVSSSSPAPMDWDRETLHDYTSFRDPFYGSPHEDDLPVPDKDFMFSTPPTQYSPLPSLESCMVMLEDQIMALLGGKTNMFDPCPAPDEDITVNTLAVELEEKLTVEPTTVEIEIDVELEIEVEDEIEIDPATPVIPLPSLTQPMSISSPQGCVRSSKLHSRTSRSTAAPYDISKSSTRQRATAPSENRHHTELKEPTRALSPAKFISTLLGVPRTTAKELLTRPRPRPCPRSSPMLESQAGAIRTSRRSYRQQEAFSCSQDSEVYEPSLEAVLEAIRDIKQHEVEQCPTPDADSEKKKKSKIRILVTKGTSWIKRSAKRVHKELKRG
ncbi:hypothetical protein QCA50_008608 [Cerrena zonata]|uniref:Uncharacterized protein n=1 Tax=Cerrena zonata TaxID=2478898 RepID=A0AAW0G3F7_9APHY